MPRTGVMKDKLDALGRAARLRAVPPQAALLRNPPARLAREIVKTEGYQTSRCQRKKVEMLFAHLNAF
jgi:hypothetical protein